MKKIYLALCAAASLLTVGCISQPVGLSASSEPLIPGSYVEVGPAKGTFNTVVVMGIPASEPGSPGQKALERALESSGGDALVKVSVDSKLYNCGVAVLAQTEVTGTAVRKLNNE